MLPDAATFQADADRFSGRAPLGSGGPAVSRYVSHPDTPRTVNHLLTEMSALGYCAYTHSFTYGGKTLLNVIADMPRTGPLRIRTEPLKKLLQVLRRYPRP